MKGEEILIRVQRIQLIILVANIREVLILTVSVVTVRLCQVPSR